MKVKDLKKAIEHIDDRADVCIRFSNDYGEEDFVVEADTVSLCIDEDSDTPHIEIFKRGF